MLDNLLNPIRKMQIDQNEFSGAKGIFFLNPGNFDDVGGWCDYFGWLFDISG